MNTPKTLFSRRRPNRSGRTPIGMLAWWLVVLAVMGVVGCSKDSNPLSDSSKDQTVACVYVGALSGYNHYAAVPMVRSSAETYPFQNTAFIVIDTLGGTSDPAEGFRIIMGYTRVHEPNFNFDPDAPSGSRWYSAEIAWIAEVKAEDTTWTVSRLYDGLRFEARGSYTESTITGTYERTRLNWDGSEFVYQEGEFQGEFECLHSSEWPGDRVPDWVSIPYVPDTSTTHDPVSLFSIDWDGSQYIAGGNAILVSPDARNWSYRRSVGEGDIRDIIVGNNQILGVGDQETLVRSSDGIQWEKVFASKCYYCIGQGGAWSGERYVVIGSGLILTSTDGFEWHVSDQEIPSGARDVIWTGDNFVMIGSTETLTSPDGLTWVSTPRTVTGSFRSVTYTNNEILALRIESDATHVYMSGDGITWIWKTRIESCRLWTIAWSGTRYVVFGNDGINSPEYLGYTSTDGSVWEQCYPGPGIGYEPGHRIITVVKWLNNQFVAVGGNRVLTSLDGLNWIQTVIDK